MAVGVTTHHFGIVQLDVVLASLSQRGECGFLEFISFLARVYYPLLAALLVLPASFWGWWSSGSQPLAECPKGLGPLQDSICQSWSLY